eukprot:CAMPEP_0170552118 /NCGR_PEP_ID=MMETSP0211-20121228/10074_1 /TAXON_ID=311385 /ORGANISM="Pseudokeronopsis sp., Strain OXSARD2" /LENGTH=45 /DNA_ID= /DNA_START= /DNA_END= /DNA_ORIENTATION=
MIKLTAGESASEVKDIVCLKDFSWEASNKESLLYLSHVAEESDQI